MCRAIAEAFFRDLTATCTGDEVPLPDSFLHLVQTMQDKEFGHYIGHDGWTEFTDRAAAPDATECSSKKSYLIIFIHVCIYIYMCVCVYVIICNVMYMYECKQITFMNNMYIYVYIYMHKTCKICKIGNVFRLFLRLWVGSRSVLPKIVEVSSQDVTSKLS